MVELILTAMTMAVLELGNPEPVPKSPQEVAMEVMAGSWGTGQERVLRLTAAGYDAQEIQAIADDLQQWKRCYEGWTPDPDGSVITPRGGINWYFDQYETYYNLPMQGVVRIARAHGIDGEYWVRSDGAKMLGDYVMLATNNSVYPIGTLVPCSLGMGISVDTGTFARSNPYQVDIAVEW